MDRPTVLIATPMHTGVGAAKYITSMVDTTVALLQAGVGLSYRILMYDSLITRARNDMVHDFLESSATHLMWIDGDIGFGKDDVLSMIQADKDILCGLYPKKEIDWNRVTQAVNDGVPPEDLNTYVASFVVNIVNPVETGTSDQPLEVGDAGTGFMLIKRGVFETLADKVPSYTRERDCEKIKEFFATGINPTDNRLMSEDYYFCKVARQHGYKIYAAPWVHLNHTGPFTFDGTIHAADTTSGASGAYLA